MKSALLACVFAAALSGAAVAQSGTPMPQVRLPTPSQATLRPTPRQLELLRVAGLTTAPSSIRSPITLSVRRPIGENASLSFVLLDSLTPGAETQGLAIVQPNAERGDQAWVEIRFRADATSRYIIDCAVGGPGTTNFRFVRVAGETTGERTADSERARALLREVSTVTISDGRVGTVLQPRGTAGVQMVYLEGLGVHSWQFRSCEIAPVG